MASFKGYFDGRTIVLDGPHDAAPPQRVLVHIEPLREDTVRAGSAPASLAGVPGVSLIRFAGSIAADDLRAMQDAIRAGCEQVDRDGW